jgi:hypothetical protein
MKSMNQPRGYSGSGNRNYVNSGGNQVARRQSSEGRISPWLPLAFGAFALLVVGRALAESDRRRHASNHWYSRIGDRFNDWWPDIRDTAEETGSRARSWFYDVAPSRRQISSVLSSGSDWLPDTRATKRQLLQNFDWSNPPRWLRDVDLTDSSKRRRFMRDLKRYGTKKSDSLLSSLGFR